MSDGNTNIGVFSLIIAGVSAVISAFALHLSHRASKDAKQAQDRSNALQKENNELQKRMVSLEETRQEDAVIEVNKAKLFAVIEKQPIQSANLRRQALKEVLVIRNEGQCEARNINVLLEKKPIMEHSAIPKGLTEIKSVGANSTIGYDLSLSMGTSPPFEIEITWEDDSGIGGIYKTTLTI